MRTNPLFKFFIAFLLSYAPLIQKTPNLGIPKPQPRALRQEKRPDFPIMA
jgi:hypothetical protein